MNSVIKVPKKIFGFDWCVEKNQYVCNRIELKEFFGGDGFSKFVGSNSRVVSDLGKVGIKNYFVVTVKCGMFFFEFIDLLIFYSDIPPEKTLCDLLVKYKYTKYNSLKPLKCEFFKILYYFYFQVFSGEGDFFYFLDNKFKALYLFIKNRRLLEKSEQFFDKNKIDVVELNHDYDVIAKSFGLILKKVTSFDIGLCLIAWNVMLYCGCRISSIKTLKIDDLKGEYFEILIHKQKDGVVKKIKYKNIEYFKDFFRRVSNNESIDFEDLIYDDTSLFKSCIRRNTLLFLKKHNVDEKFYDFCNVLIRKSHIARHLCINHLIDLGFTCEEIADWTGQTVDIIQKNYVARLINDKKSKLSHEKIISQSIFFREN